MIDIPSFSKLDPPTLHPCIYDATATVAVRFKNHLHHPSFLSFLIIPLQFGTQATGLSKDQPVCQISLPNAIFARTDVRSSP
jgi:hypothetical protein